MNVIKKITVKPWLPEPASEETLSNVAALSPPPAKVGLRVFLAVVTALFLLLVIAYLSRSRFPDWQSLAGAPWQPLSSPWLLWLNTALLMASSIALQWTRGVVRRDDPDGAKTGLALAGFFAVAFLLGQLWVWQELKLQGYGVASNPASSFFYLITGLHGFHLLGGLVAWVRTTARVWRGVAMERVRLSVELCTVYWHFLLMVWLVLFALLTAPQETLGAIAALCGF